MYKEGFVASIQVNNEILREHKGVVYLPFNSVYSIYLKNTTNKNVEVMVAVEDKWVVSTIMKPKTTEVVNTFADNQCFKFIEMTNKIKQFRGETPFDGRVTISYRFESNTLDVLEKYFGKNNKEFIPYPVPYSVPYERHPYIRRNPWDPYYPTHQPTWCHESIYSSANNTRVCFDASCNDGITTKGGYIESSNPKDIQSIMEMEEKWNEINLYLVGNKRVITTGTKLQCKECGTKGTGKFCSECGSSLLG